MKQRPEQIEVREQVYFEPKFFKVYNHIQERYARRVGFQAWGVYCTLKQFADWNSNAPKCTVSLARMAIIWGVTTRTIKRAIRTLRDFGLIRVKKNQASSTYIIMKVPVPRSQLRQDKFVPSEVTKTSRQRGHERPIDQTLFTRPSLPERAAPKGSGGASAPALSKTHKASKTKAPALPRLPSGRAMPEKPEIDLDKNRAKLEQQKQILLERYKNHGSSGSTD